MEINQVSILTVIRAKIYAGIIENADIEGLKDRMQELEKKQYYLIQVAAYEKMNQKKNALNVIKQMEKEGIKVTGEVKDRLKSKKRNIFDLDKWDELIGWSTEITKQYEQEKREKQQEKEEIKQTQTSENIEQQENSKLTRAMKEPEIRKPKAEIIKTNIEEGHIGNDKKQHSKKVQKKKKVKNSNSKIDTIESAMSLPLKETIEKINMKYYIGMQYKETERKKSKEYYQLLREIQEMGIDDKKKTMQRMNLLMKQDYIENDRQARYIRKYDKLQSILNCDKDNKRAQMELMLVLINEGYREIVKREFSKEDYEFINEIIKQYYKKLIKPEDAKKIIDDYCI